MTPPSWILAASVQGKAAGGPGIAVAVALLKSKGIAVRREPSQYGGFTQLFVMPGQLEAARAILRRAGIEP